MGFGPPPTSPFVYETRDHAGLALRVTVPYNDDTLAIAGRAAVYRDAGCVYATVVIGPPSAPVFTIPVPVGDSTFDPAEAGLISIDDLHAAGITATP